MSCDPWPLAWPCGAAPSDSTEDQQAIAVSAAQDVLWALTGRILGTCTVTEQYQPIGAPCNGDDRTVQSAKVIHLRQRPVDRVLEVKVNGVALDVSGYQLARNGRLIRLGGSWPLPSEYGDAPVEVTYVWGVRLVPFVETDPLPQLAYLAASAVGEVAVEFLTAMCGGDCKLPSRIASLTRQGITIDFNPAADFVANGLTGLPLADAFIRTVNPSRIVAPSAVFSPDMARLL